MLRGMLLFLLLLIDFVVGWKKTCRYLLVGYGRERLKEDPSRSNRQLHFVVSQLRDRGGSSRRFSNKKKKRVEGLTQMDGITTVCRRLQLLLDQ